MKYVTLLCAGLGLILFTTSGCSHHEADKSNADHGDADHGDADHGDADHGDADHGHDGEDAAAHTEDSDADHGHEHAEDPLGTFKVGDLDVEFTQGHGGVVAGKEGHLVVKLPYSDQGATVVRAWIGTQDRTLSYVGKGEYAPSHGDYDIHATAPDPLPEGSMWWIEIEKPDGSKTVGSAKPLFE
ncbi:MAG: hypothetical protein ACI8QZ_000368 [Chlamydiales bacterium]|jgi:hypothetical protein